MISRAYRPHTGQPKPKAATYIQLRLRPHIYLIGKCLVVCMFTDLHCDFFTEIGCEEMVVYTLLCGIGFVRDECDTTRFVMLCYDVCFCVTSNALEVGVHAQMCRGASVWLACFQ